MPFPNPHRPPNSGNKPGKSTLHDPEQKRLRALKMLEARVGQSKSYQTIADEFNVSIKTVRRVFDYIKKAGLIVQAEDKILDELVPAAHRALKTALEDRENPQLAGQLGLKLMENALPGFGKKSAPKSGPTTDDNALAKAIAEARELYGNVLDGETVTQPVLTLPAGTETAADGGDSDELHHPQPAGPGDDPLGEAPVGAAGRERSRGDADADEGDA